MSEWLSATPVATRKFQEKLLGQQGEEKGLRSMGPPSHHLSPGLQEIDSLCPVAQKTEVSGMKLMLQDAQTLAHAGPGMF